MSKQTVTIFYKKNTITRLCPGGLPEWWPKGMWVINQGREDFKKIGFHAACSSWKIWLKCSHQPSLIRKVNTLITLLKVSWDWLMLSMIRKSFQPETNEKTCEKEQRYQRWEENLRKNTKSNTGNYNCHCQYISHSIY